MRPAKSFDRSFFLSVIEKTFSVQKEEEFFANDYDEDIQTPKEKYDWKIIIPR